MTNYFHEHFLKLLLRCNYTLSSTLNSYKIPNEVQLFSLFIFMLPVQCKINGKVAFSSGVFLNKMIYYMLLYSFLKKDNEVELETCNISHFLNVIGIQRINNIYEESRWRVRIVRFSSCNHSGSYHRMCHKACSIIN